MPSGSISHQPERPTRNKRHAQQSSENDSYDLALSRRVASRHAVIPHSAVVDRKMSDRQFRVYALMCLHANQFDEAWAREDTLAALMGVSQQYISRIIREIAAMGYVEIRRIGFPARNHYFVPVKPNINATEITENQRENQENQENAADISDAFTENLPVTTTRVVTARAQLQPPEVVPVTTSGGCAKNSVIEQCSSVSQVSSLSTSLARSAKNRPPADQAPLTRTRERLNVSALKRDPLVITLIACFGVEPATPHEWDSWRIAVNDLHAAGVTANDIPRAIQAYQALHPHGRITPMALARNWSQIREGKSHDLAQLEITQRARSAAVSERREREAADAERKAQERAEVERLLSEYGYTDGG